ncbi:reverse transcriptase/maturase family protein [Erythrobacter sp. SN021]|uniref:reverse transcriptase/maturase family protein n=1 Tax=Erythrobacter sp. SN021 TaxID=2912574 RepID=UPI001F2C681D|nr:reverse transcriptase/maturase family protein [Erythrobacter sp. SN021]MCF8882529.1 reverse transcriptase/maturase family protein [Erythrobacter sp. SN021]
MTDWQLKPSDLKRYPHFDQVLKPDEIVALVTSPTRVAQNSFFPLLRYTKRWQPFRPGRDSGKARPKPKDRPIRYAARRDAYIFAYYRHLLSGPYEAELERLGISHCPVAYRRIPTEGDARRGKCNIQFAQEAVARIRELGDCHGIAVDISNYFESIDHERLKALWCRLLDVERLPPDHFAVFKNITKYRVVDRVAAYRRLGFYGVKSFTKGGHPIEGYLVPYRDIPTQLCSPHDFRQKILGENGQYESLVIPNDLPHGIPQGAPISDLLANLYLIDFDVEMNALATSLGGTYVRYSDDILLILPVDEAEARRVMDELPERIRKFGDELVIKPEKSSLVRYVQEDDGQRCELVAGKGKNGLEYLGFRYDGRNVFLRDATVSNLYRKVASVARNHSEATVRRYPGKSYAELCQMFNFEQFSKRFGRVEGFEPASTARTWTFWTYVMRAAEEFGPLGKKITGQVARLRRHSRIRVDQEIEKALQRKAKSEASGEVNLS